MLADGKMTGFIFTKDYEKARAFYEEKAGFAFVSLDQFALVMKAGPSTIRIVKLADFVPQRATVLGWEVADIEKVAAWLQGRGVVMENYPFVQDHALGIWTAPSGDRVAWFKDADGNVLGISQHTKPVGS